MKTATYSIAKEGHLPHLSTAFLYLSDEAVSN